LNLDQKSLRVIGDLLKAPASLAESWNMCIPIGVAQTGELNGYLLPINMGHLKNSFVIEKMTTWRQANQHAYTGRFVPTVEKTKSWLDSQVLKNPNRLLFLVSDTTGVVIGHLGLALNVTSGSIEVDNVVRGEEHGPGLMGLALIALENFAETELTVEKLSLRVLGSNQRALNFYAKAGYIKISETPVEVSYSNDFVGVKQATSDIFVLMEKELRGDPIPEKVLTAGPLVGSLEAAYALDAARNGWNAKHSDYIERFEREFADFVGAKYSMATSSCTGALHLALLSAGIGPGDEVIVPETTWVATASAVAYTGATPVFCDVELDTWTMDVKLLDSLITKRTKAIIPVHLYGFPANIQEICEIAQRHSIRVIEDAAPAIGAEKGGQAVGTFGDIGCFSFQGAKLLVTGEGGMLTTDDEELFRRAKKLQDHGRRPGTFWIEELGYKYKMSNVTAAVGLAQIRRAENQIFRKQRIRRWYEEALGECDGLVFQMPTPDSTPIHWMTSIRILDGKADSARNLMSKLGAAGIDTRPVFPAISRYQFWQGGRKEPGVNALKISECGINLPSGVGLSRLTVEHISKQIEKMLVW
jgi:perosamine synthetase